MKKNFLTDAKFSEAVGSIKTETAGSKGRLPTVYDDFGQIVSVDNRFNVTAQTQRKRASVYRTDRVYRGWQDRNHWTTTG